ncbi:MAG: DUF421 domain-containing protein [Clostridia bacterium]|nr:DUF421 domain-containing protein [Clostridia bacterium]
MAVIFIRTVIIYAVLFAVLRLMGKRQIGELQPSELVSTLILSQIASQPIASQSIPLSYGIVPVVAVVCLEVIASYLTTRVPALKRIFVGRPSILIDRGRIDQAELLRQRVTVEELMSELRSNGVADPGDVYYAVMEESGSISVLLKAPASPPARQDLGVEADERGMARLVISDGVINRENLAALGKNERWLMKRLGEAELTAADVFVMTCDEKSNVRIVKKRGKGGGS